MIMRQPFLPDVDLGNGGEASVAGAKPGMAVSAYFGYMKGVANKLAKKHIPDVIPHNDTLAGPVGRRGDQVGGFTLMATEDLKRVAPLWLRYTEDVRFDPDAWELTGDAYSAHPGDKPWISEMYGYSFGAAKADVWHTVNHNAMLYPGYETTAQPMVLHYGLLWSIAGTEYSFDKHWHNQFDVLQCPPWDLDKRKPTKGLFPYPPQPSSFNTTGFKLLRDLLSVEPIIILNKAFCEKHRQRCPPSDELTQHCAYVDWMVIDLDAAYARLELPDPCVNGDVRCKKWADNKECETNPGFMMEQCKLACGVCSRKDGRTDVVEATGAGDDDDDDDDGDGDGDGNGGGGMGGDGGSGGEAGAFDASIRNNNGVRKKVIRINNEIIVQEVKAGDDDFQKELDRMKKKEGKGGDNEKEEEEELSLNDLHAKIILDKYGQKQNNTMPPNFYLDTKDKDKDGSGSGEKVPDLEHREGVLKKRDAMTHNNIAGLDELQRVRNLIVKGSASHIRGGGDGVSLDIFANASGTGRDANNNDDDDEEPPEKDLDVNNFNARTSYNNNDDDAVLQDMDRDHLIVALKRRCTMHTEWDVATLTECLELAGQALKMQDVVYGGGSSTKNDDNNGSGGIVLSRNDINSKRDWGRGGSGHDLGRLVGQRLRHAHIGSVDGGRLMTGTAALVHRLGLLGMMLWGCGILIVACCLPRLRRSMGGGGGGRKGGGYHRHVGGNGVSGHSGHGKLRPYNGTFARYKPRSSK